jgi:hypothetical protein
MSLTAIPGTAMAEERPTPPPQAESQASSTSAPGPAREGSTGGKASDLSGSRQSAGSTAAPEKEAAFVDRDGDGIQDGQEHRFRSKRGARNRDRSGDADFSGSGQFQRRRGQQEGNGPGHGGRGP